MTEIMPLKERYCLLGLPIHAVTLESAAQIISSAIDQNRRCFLTTPNLNFTELAAEDDDFYQSVLQSDLVVADGMPLIWVAKIQGLPITERVAGSDLFNYLSEHPRKKKIRVFFFGGETGIAQKAHIQLNLTSQGMLSCGFYDPGFVSVEQMSSPEIIERINMHAPDFIVVALGAKKGQQWIMRNKEHLKAPVISHLGAVINFVAGHVQRAPLQWQRSGLEWLWRIRQEPKLYKRYLIDGVGFISKVLFQVIPLKLYSNILTLKEKNKVGRVYIVNNDADALALKMSGRLDYNLMCKFESILSDKNNDKETIEIDMKAVSYIDNTVVSGFLIIKNRLIQLDRDIYFNNVSKKIIILFKLYGVYKRFRIS